MSPRAPRGIFEAGSHPQLIGSGRIFIRPDPIRAHLEGADSQAADFRQVFPMSNSG